MTRRFITVLIVMIGFAFKINAQVHMDILEKSQDKDFKGIISEVEAYYKGKDKGKGSGYKQFKRWEYHNKSRLSADGKIINVTTRNFNEHYYYQEKLKQVRGQAQARKQVGGDWHSYGPFAMGEKAIIGNKGGLGRVNTVELDPSQINQVFGNILYVGTPAGGLWRSTNGGDSWQPLTDGMPQLGVSGIAIDYSTPEDNRTIYILTGDGDGNDTRTVGVLKSTDHGRTWYSTGLRGDDELGVENLLEDLKSTDKTISNGFKLRIHPTNPNILYVASRSGIYKTVNGGETWVRTRSGIFYDIEFKPDDPTIMYASTRDEIFKSTNSGDLWSLATTNETIPAYNYPPNGEPSNLRIELAVSPDNPNLVYAVCGQRADEAVQNNGFNGLFCSEDAGSHYIRQSSSPNILGRALDGIDNVSQASYDLAIAVSPNNAAEIYVGGIHVWKSTDFGRNWKVVSNSRGAPYVHADIHELKFTLTSLLCASDGGLDVGSALLGGIAWNDISSGLQISQVYRMNAESPKSLTGRSPVYYGAQDNGLNFMKVPFIGTQISSGDGFDIAPLPNDKYVLGTTQFGKLKLIYNETTSIVVTPDEVSDQEEPGEWNTPFVVFTDLTEHRPDNRVFVGYEDVFYQSRNHSPVIPTRALSAGKWENISNGQLGTENCDHIAVAQSDGSVVYVSKGGRLFRTENSGNDWDEISINQFNTIDASGSLSFKHDNITYFTIHPNDPNSVYLTLGGYSNGKKVYHTSDGGQTWNNISQDLPNVPVNCIVYENNSPDRIYIGTDIGIFQCDNITQQWRPFSHNLPRVPIAELDIDYGTDELYAATFGRGIWRSDLFGKSCTDNLTFGHDLDGFKHYTANNITSTSLVETFTDVNFTAANTITLNPGFRTLPGADFSAEIDGNVCSEGINKSLTPTVNDGTYAGRLPNTVSILTSTQGEEFIQNENLIVFPNITSADTYVEYDLKELGNVSINFYDLQGVLKSNYIFDNQNTGKFIEKFDVSNFSSGTYIVELISRDVKLSKRIIVE